MENRHGERKEAGMPARIRLLFRLDNGKIIFLFAVRMQLFGSEIRFQIQRL